MSDGHPDLNTVEARQGSRTRYNLWVLIFGTILVVLALFGAYAFYQGRLEGSGGQRAATAASAQAFDAPAPAPIQSLPPNAAETAPEQPTQDAAEAQAPQQ